MFLGGIKQYGPDPIATSFGSNVNRNNVPGGRAKVGYQKSDDAEVIAGIIRQPIAGGFVLSDQTECAGPAYVSL